jgi:anti-sigma regulatory factor (Ser/Thr protein kinase)
VRPTGSPPLSSRPPTGEAEVERVELAPRPASVAAARRLVRAFAAKHRLNDELADAMCLTASELVTNSVLHARTSLVLSLALGPDRVRIGVHDHLPATPTVRHYPPEAVTGRGLGVVAALSRTWGIDADNDGKLVWAEIGLHGGASADAAAAPRTTGPPPRAARPQGGSKKRTVLFPGVPVDAYLALQEHNDALYRELELLAIEAAEDPSAATRPPRLATLARELLGPEFRDASDAYREAVAAARERGEKVVDLRAQLPAEAVALARAYVALLDEADDYCRAGVLLTTPPEPRVTALRHWFVEQCAVQLLDGRPPAPPSL